MKDIIAPQVKEVVNHAVEIRHLLHQTPEGAFAEHATADIVIRELKSMGMDSWQIIAGTGLLAEIVSDPSGPTVAFRADMDALAISDESNTPYCSKRPGYSHACGHDGHLAAMLAAAKVLCKLKSHFFGRIRFIFQPAEEAAAGAKAMIEAGALEDPTPKAIFALHCWPGIPSGALACRPGLITAGSDSFRVTIEGLGGHAARPHLTRSPILGAAKLVEQLTTLTNHSPNSDNQCVVSVGSIQGGSAANVIPSLTTIEGTIRTTSRQQRQLIHQEFYKTVGAVCSQAGLEPTIDIHTSCPPIQNDPTLHELFTQTCDELLGNQTRMELDIHSMGSEDFAYYCDHVPGLLIRLGMGQDSPQLHAPEFDFNDDAIENAVMILVGLAMRSLEPPEVRQ